MATPSLDRFLPLPGRSVVAVSGADAMSFLDGLITNSLDGLSPDRAVYAGLLTPQGKLLCDFILALRDETVLIDVAASQAPAFVQRFGLYKLRAKVVIELRPDWGVGVAFGPAAGEAKPIATGVVFSDPRLTELGVRAIAPIAELTGTDSSVGDYEALRLGLGVGEGAEIGGERSYPLEANFEPLHGVDFAKGCYVGQELTARMKHRAGLRKRIVPIRFDGDIAIDSRVSAGTTELGQVLAARPGVGLALLRLDRLADASAPPTIDGKPVRIEWPAWLPPLESKAS